MRTARNSDIDTIAATTVQGKPFRGNVTMKALMSVERMVMLEIRYPKGSGSPEHSHDHESLCYVVSGRVRGTIEDDESVLQAGDACTHPVGVRHSVEALEDSVIIEIKSPAVPLENFLGGS